MTTFNYLLMLDDGERLALDAAISSYLQLCAIKLEKNGPQAPFWAHLRHMQAIQGRITQQIIEKSSDRQNDPLPAILITIPYDENECSAD